MSRSAEEWGRLAVSLPGWRWMSGMQTLHLPNPGLPDPDDPATAGCLLAMLGDRLESVDRLDDGFRVMWFSWERIVSTPGFVSVGRACIAAAEAIGEWPGGEE